MVKAEVHHAQWRFFASWCVNPGEWGDRELPTKAVQGRLGHSNIPITRDTYDHLFPRADDRDELEVPEHAFLVCRTNPTWHRIVAQDQCVL